MGDKINLMAIVRITYIDQDDCAYINTLPQHDPTIYPDES